MKIRATTIGTYTVTLTSPFVTSLRSVYEYRVSTFAIVAHDGINGIGEIDTIFNQLCEAINVSQA